MAVKDPDHEARANPVTNFVAGAGVHGKAVNYVTAVAPDGSVHKLNAANVSDWRSRGPHWTVAGPWTGDGSAPDDTWSTGVVPADEAAELDAEDAADTDAHDKEMLGHHGEPADVALKELHALKAEASLLGIKVNDTWGKRRLNAEIAAAKLRAAQTAAAAAPVTPPAAK